MCGASFFGGGAKEPSMAQHRKYMKMARSKTKMEPVVYKNYYEVLGLGRDATADRQISRAPLLMCLRATR